MREKYLVVDLDGTLYPLSSGLEDECEALCIKFFEQRLKFTREQAIQTLSELRQKYGYESEGIEDLYGIPTKEYLEYVCDTDPEILSPNPELEQLLRQWPKKIFILTDSTKSHTEKVLQHLGIDPSIFFDIFDSEAGGFAYKYQDIMFEKFFEKEKIKGQETILIEDKEANLKQGKKFGMTTILISETPVVNQNYVDFQFVNINEALRFLSNN